MSDLESKRLVVLIIGAGIGGLMTGILLERAGISYHIFERESASRPFGGVVSLNSSIQPALEQVGLLNEIISHSRPCHSINLHNNNLDHLGSISVKDTKDISGYDNLMLTRRKLYEILLSKIPKYKVTFRKRVIGTEESDNTIIIHCADNTSYSGNLLIGADGACSSIRQLLFKRLKQQDLLPKADSMDGVTYVSLVGVAKPSNPKRYREMQNTFPAYETIVGLHKMCWGLVPLPDNEISWNINIQMAQKDANKQPISGTHWTTESNSGLLKRLEDLPCPWGGTMADILNDTPHELRAMAIVEEKLYETWYHNRTVLLGDARHKHLVTSALSSVNAIQDAIILTNCLYDISDASPESIATAFRDYYEQRYPHSKKAFKNSHVLSGIIKGQTWRERIMRKIVFNHLPNWVKVRNDKNFAAYRPQITWLPPIPNRGTGYVFPQKSSRRIMADQNRIQTAESVENIIAAASTSSSPALSMAVCVN